MNRLSARHVRTRLTLWYVGVLAAVLGLYVAGTTAFLFLSLRRELDQNLAQDIEAVESMLSFGPDGVLRIGTDSHEETEAGGPQRFVEVRSVEGSLLYRSKELGDAGLGGVPAPREGEQGYSERSARLPDGTHIRLGSRLHSIAGRRVLIRVAHSEERFRHEFQELVSVLVLGFPLALVFAGAGGYGLARRALAPLDAMARRAEEITAERLEERLPVDNPDDELGHLARVFNETLARLERSFEHLRRFTADASHELRTPLTAIRSVGEVGLQRDGDQAYYRDIIGSMLEEASRLTHLVENLLTISRADAGHIQLHRSEFPLLVLARESAALLEVLAEEKRQRLIVQGDETLYVFADRLILRQALLNLIDNALKYSPAGSPVAVQVESSADREAILEVMDNGPGIPSEHQSRIFDRFCRVDKARSREAGGAGLGLPIAKWAVEANGGRIELECGQGRGSAFRIRLPCVKKHAPAGSSSSTESGSPGGGTDESKTDHKPCGSAVGRRLGAGPERKL